jgi:hypothetical protein
MNAWPFNLPWVKRSIFKSLKHTIQIMTTRKKYSSLAKEMTIVLYGTSNQSRGRRRRRRKPVCFVVCLKVAGKDIEKIFFSDILINISHKQFIWWLATIIIFEFWKFL